MVSISIFAIVATIAIGALLSADRVNQKAQAIKLAMDNLNFALDSMFYKMEKGNLYTCGNVTPTGVNCTGNAISFSSPKNPPIGISPKTYYYGWNQANHSLEFSDGAGAPVSITMPALDIQSFQVDIKGYASGEYPWARIQLSGLVTVGHEHSDFALETVVSEHWLWNTKALL